MPSSRPGRADDDSANRRDKQTFEARATNPAFLSDRGAITGDRATRARGRSLKSAFESTGGPAPRSRSSSISPAKQGRNDNLKPLPAHASSRRSLGRSQNRGSTPPPSQPSTMSPALPFSTASPPHGLEEAYQRIVDEERLAASGNTDDESTGDPYIYNHLRPDRSISRDRIRVDRLRSSASPISLGRSRASSPRIGKENVPLAREEDRENDTQGSGSGSISGLSLLENDTEDSFARTLAKHARDQQRIKGALNKEGQLFRKARIGKRSGLTAENLLRKDREEGLRELNLNGDGDVISERSDPPVNIPRTWGSKGRLGSHWMRQIGEMATDKRRSSEGDMQSFEKPAKPRAASEKVDWMAAAADVPLPSVEEKSPLIERQQQESSPPNKRNAALDRIREWEIDEEFTANSLQISNSPPINTRNTSIDRIMEREIETLRSRAVTTNILGEIREKVEKKLSEENAVPSEEKLPEPETSNAARKEALQKAPEFDADDGEAIPNTPIVIYKTSGIRNPLAEKPIETEISKERPKSGHERQDSFELLRQLARASATPSPRADREKALKQQEEKKPIREEKKSEGNPPAKPPKEAPAETISAASESQTPEPETRSTPQPQKTPKVMGGWVDTPGPAIGAQPPSPPPSDREADKENIAPGIKDFLRGSNASPLFKNGAGLTKSSTSKGAQEPRRPKSGLSEVICAAKDAKKDGGVGAAADEYGDTTIGSLQELIANDTGFTSLLGDSVQDLELHLQKASKGAPLSQAEKERQLELLAYERMNERLETLRRSIREAKHGIAGLEKEVEKAGDEYGPCKTCGCTARVKDCNGWHLRLPLPKLRKRSADGRARLTWLGWIWVVLWAYVISEYILWYLYAPPKYATSMAGYHIDWTAPHAPWATATYAWRRTKRIWRPFSALFKWLFSTIFEEFGIGVSTTAQPAVVYHTPPQPTAAFEENWSMENDEIL